MVPNTEGKREKKTPRMKRSVKITGLGKFLIMNRHRGRRRKFLCIPRIANADSRMHLNGNDHPDRIVLEKVENNTGSVMEIERAPLRVELRQKRTSSDIGEVWQTK